LFLSRGLGIIATYRIRKRGRRMIEAEEIVSLLTEVNMNLQGIIITISVFFIIFCFLMFAILIALAQK
jgi:hypothetical protein